MAIGRHLCNAPTNRRNDSFANNLRKAFEEARKTGNAEGVKQLADQKAREHRALMKQIDANTRATAAAGRRDRQAKRDARH